MKGVFYIKDICQEFSDNVEIDEGFVYALIHKKYYGDISRRCKIHNWKTEIRRKRSFMILVRVSPLFI